MRGEVVCDVVGVPHRRGGADGADDLLRCVGVLTSDVVDEGELGEAELGTKGAREGVGRVGRVAVVVAAAAARGAGLAVVEVVIGARQDALHGVGGRVAGRRDARLKREGALITRARVPSRVSCACRCRPLSKRAMIHQQCWTNHYGSTVHPLCFVKDRL